MVSIVKENEIVSEDQSKDFAIYLKKVSDDAISNINELFKLEIINPSFEEATNNYWVTYVVGEKNIEQLGDIVLKHINPLLVMNIKKLVCIEKFFKKFYHTDLTFDDKKNIFETTNINDVSNKEIIEKLKTFKIFEDVYTMKVKNIRKNLLKVYNEILFEDINNFVEEKGKIVFENMINKMLDEYWIEYNMDKSADKSDKLYLKSIKYLSNDFIHLLKKLTNINNLKNNFEDCFGTVNIDENNYYRLVKTNIEHGVPSDKDIISSLKKTLPWVEDVFKDYVNNMNKKIIIKIMFFGKLGSGKTTIVCVIDGFIASIENRDTKKRVVSNNGRGTTDICSYEIKFGNTSLDIIDPYGGGDTGTNFQLKDLVDKVSSKVSDFNLKNQMIFYTIDGNLPRFDNTELEILDYLFRQFKMVYPTSLKWWNQIVIILSKCNTITLLKYGSSGGLPKYEYKEWLRTNKKNKSNTNKKIYNKYYFEKKFKPAVKEWKQFIEERRDMKIFNDSNDIENGESFTQHFKRKVREHYPRLVDSEEEKEVIKNFRKRLVMAGEAKQQEEHMDKNWQYKDCTICPIPNIEDLVPDAIEEVYEEEIQKLIRKNTIVTDWFSDLINEVYAISKSDGFKLKLYTMNEIKKKQETQENNGNDTTTGTTNTFVNFNQETHQSHQESMRSKGFFATLWSKIVNFFTLNWW